MDIRTLRSDEIECRVQSVKKTKKGVGCIILLYKDARCDMKILDETFGVLNWQRSHQLINNNLFCTIEVWDEEKQQWISKQDVGTESNTEKEKGQASDSFKRACFNLGIGRELYTAPFIWVNLKEGEYKEFKDKLRVSISFTVKQIEYNKVREIIKLTLIDNEGNIRYSLGENKPTVGNKNNNSTLSEAQVNRLFAIAKSVGIDNKKVKQHVLTKYGTTEINTLTKQQYDEACEGYEKLKK